MGVPLAGAQDLRYFQTAPRGAEPFASPMYGKTSEIRVLGGQLLQGLPTTFSGGRYHSIHTVPEALPAELELTAETADKTPMAVEHKSLPMAAIQFHPESAMTLRDGTGLRIIENDVKPLIG